jgi:ADP-ribose pyrophosphatase
VRPPGASGGDRVFLYLATALSPAHQGLDADEVLAVHRLPLETAMQMIANGELQDAKSICGLMLAERHLSAT